MCPKFTLFARHAGESVSPFFTSQIAHGLRWATCRRSWYLRPYLSGSTSHCRHAAWASQGETMPGWWTRIQGSETKSQSETTWLHQKSPRQGGTFHQICFLEIMQGPVFLWVDGSQQQPTALSWPFSTYGEWLPRDPSACLPVRAYVRSALRCRCPC